MITFRSETFLGVLAATTACAELFNQVHACVINNLTLIGLDACVALLFSCQYAHARFRLWSYTSLNRYFGTRT